MQDSVRPYYLRDFMANLESTLGCTPDWRHTAFWRETGVVEDWWRAREAAMESSMPSLAEFLQQDK